jgi:hypothetical protein
MKLTFLKPHLPSEFSLSAELCVLYILINYLSNIYIYIYIYILINCSKKSLYFHSVMSACIACFGSLKDFVCNHNTEIAFSL